MEKNDAFGSGRFFDFPIEDSLLPEISSDGLNFLHEFVSQGAKDSREQLQENFAENFATNWPVAVATAPQSMQAFSLSPPDTVAESRPPEPTAWTRQTHNSSSSRELDDATTHNVPTHEDLCIRDRNRAAQKRFREREKARKVNHNKQMKELQQKMQALSQENQGLRTHCKLLQHNVLVNQTQNTDLQRQQEDRVAALQQEVILLQSKEIYSRGIDQPDLSMEDCKSLTMEGFVPIFEVLIRKYKFLLEHGAWDHGSPAHNELKFLVQNRRVEEARLALFSRWTSAVIGWNREESATQRPPSASFYADVISRLNLTAEQQQEWLAARRKLLLEMSDLKFRRDKAALAVGMLVLRCPQQAPGISNEGSRLRDALEEERQAVLGFLFSCIDCCLSPAQEATLDVLCYPWWPCIWSICNILAHKHKKEPPDTLVDPLEENPLFPHFSAARFLKEPMMSRMGGLLIKRAQLEVPVPQDVVQAANEPVPRIADLRYLTGFEVMCGKHLNVGIGPPFEPSSVVLQP